VVFGKFFAKLSDKLQECVVATPVPIVCQVVLSKEYNKVCVKEDIFLFILKVIVLPISTGVEAEIVVVEGRGIGSKVMVCAPYSSLLFGVYAQDTLVPPSLKPT
jgi:hypothetical protein